MGRQRIVVAIVVAITLAVMFPPARARARAVGETGARDYGSRLASAASGSHSCQVRGDGTIRCWGQNDFGQLGNGSSGQGQFSAGPVAVPGISDALAVAAGRRHTCALRASGTVFCWGDNGFGQLGNASGGTGVLSSVPVQAVGLTDAVAIAAGFSHSCALRMNGRLSCWGSNSVGQVGAGSGQATFTTPVAVSSLTDAVAVTAGQSHSCAVRANGRASCWGSNASGQLGHAQATSPRTIPESVDTLTDAVGISAGELHTCAVRANGRVSCWGSNGSGQLGSAGGTALSPREVPGLADVVVVSGGRLHSCARVADGTARCWGDNSDRQLGQIGSTNEPSPATVIQGLSPDGPAPLRNVEAIAAGRQHTCAALVNDSIVCWGNNNVGQLGNGAAPDEPLLLAFMPQSAGSISGRHIVAGSAHVCARRADGTAACWGSNSVGQLGNPGAGELSTTAVPVSNAAGTGNLTGVTGLAGGGAHTCAVKIDGTVACWGADGSGQLGDDAALAGKDRPVPVVGLTGAIAVVAGSAHTCSLRANGSVACWGENSLGQLGNGNRIDQRTPVAVVGPGGTGVLGNVVALAAGQDHTCALRVDTRIFCWGSNGLGQLGPNAANEPTPSPVEVTGIATPSPVSPSQGVAAIAAGPHHSCAIRVDGAGGNVFCWGKNDVGQLGSGTANSQAFPAHPAPVQVAGLSDATAIAGGGGQLPNTPAVDVDFTCARRAGGTVRCWGNNDIGQLGDNSTTDRLQPQTSVVFRSVTRIGTSVITLFPALTRVAAITAASSSSPVACALLADGQPLCWGSDSVGQLGDGAATATSRAFAAAVPSFAFNVDPAVTLLSRGRGVIVTALVDCPADATVDIQITLSQDAASGQGHAVERCTGGLARFRVTVHPHGRTAFHPGAALAEADALVRDGGRVIDTQEWTRAVQVAIP